MKLRRSVRWVPLLALAAAAACSDDNNNVTNPTASIAIVTDQSALTVAQGATGTVTVTLARVSFTSDVALTVEGAPTGVTFDVALQSS